MTRRIAALKDKAVMTDTDWKVLGTTRRKRVEDKKSIANCVGKPLNELEFRNLPASSWALNVPSLHSKVLGVRVG